MNRIFKELLTSSKDSSSSDSVPINYTPVRQRANLKYGKKSRTADRIAALRYYSGSEDPECACCGDTNLEFLSIDHIGGGGAQQRKELNNYHLPTWLKKNNYPAGYRVLCMNCNFSIGKRGYCPHLLFNPTIKVVGEITWSNVQEAFAQLLQRKPMTVAVSSQGGDPDAAVALYSLLKLASPVITTIGIGKVYSAAVYPFMAGVKRLITPETTFLFHATILDVDGGVSMPEMRQELMGDKVNVDVLNNVLAACKFPPELDSKIKSENEAVYISAADALKYGLATSIIEG